LPPGPLPPHLAQARGRHAEHALQIGGRFV